MRALLASLVLVGCGGVHDPAPPDLFGPQPDLQGLPDLQSADMPKDPGGPIAASMNDLSILFPLTALIPASTVSTLFSSSLYELVGPINGPPDSSGSVGAAAYEDLHIVAMRLDPCFASTAPDPNGAGCIAQVRLTIQAVKSAQAGDSALHVFYALTRDEVLLFTRAVVALRNGEDLGALQPHPLLLRDGIDGAFGKGITALIEHYANPANITRVALLDAASGSLAWTLLAFDMTNDGTLPNPLIIPTLASPEPDVQSQGATQVADVTLTVALVPTTTSSDDLSPLASDDRNSLTVAQRQTAFDALVRIENPTIHTANDIDCGSCHLATPIAALVAKPSFGLDDRTSALAYAGNAFVDSSDMTPTVDTVSTKLDLHAFSYDGTIPSINQRVVNETASLVAYMNQLP